MKWAVYWEPDDIECVFFQTEAEARAKVKDLIHDCEEASADAERNLDWAITLLQVRGEVRDSPNGFQLRMVKWTAPS